MSADPARFAVVGCLTSGCQALWIVEDRHAHDTATCPQCGSTYATKRFRTFAQADDLDVIRELRARIYAERADQHESYANEDDYAILGKRAEEYLARSAGIPETSTDDAADRQRQRQRAMYAHDVEDYLDRPHRYQEAVDTYLDRRKRERKHLLEEAVNTRNERSASQATPFQEQPEQPNQTLTTPETLPQSVDVRLSDPPIAPTDLWQTLWQTDQLHARLFDALDTLSGETYRSAWATLEEWGVTALNDNGTLAYADYALNALTQPSSDRWYDVLRLTRQLGSSTVLGNSERSDIINGPVAVFAGSGVTPSVAIHLTHDFFDEHKRIQRVRFLDFLREMSKGIDVQIICHGSLVPKKLLQHHEADLPTSAVTEAPQAYHHAAKRAAGSPRDIAETALADLGLNHPAISVLERLANESNERLEYSALKTDEAFSVSEAAVGKRVRTLIDHQLISKDRLNTSNYIQLLPAAVAFLDLRDREQEAHDVQTALDAFSAADTADSSAESAGSGDLTHPPNHSHGTVCTDASTEGGKREDADVAEDVALTVDGVDDTVVASGEWLSTEHQTAVSSAVADNLDIALADESAPSRNHCGDYHVGFNEETQEIVVSVQPSPVAARTMVRLCAALLDPRLQNTILTPERLNGEDGEDLGALLESALRPFVLRTTRQLGWLPDRSASGAEYREQLVSALTDLFEDADKIGDGDDFDRALAQSVCKRGHGLAGVLTHIYDLLGWDVTRELTFPEYSRHFHEDRSTYLKTLATQLAITSRYGHYTMYRILFEERADKRADSLGAPSVDAIDPVGECLGSWVLRGPGIDRLASGLTNLAAVAELEVQDEGEHFEAFFTELQIGQATRLESIREVTERLCHMKQLEPTRPATALLYALTGSVYETATALSGLVAETDPCRRPIRLDEVRYALATLDPTSLLPDLDGDEDESRPNTARSKMIHAQLTARAPLSTGEWAKRAGVSTESIRTHRDDLEALGLLEIDDLGPGKATLYRLRLPFSDERDPDAPRPEHLIAPEGETQHRSIRDVVCDLLEVRGLFEEAYEDLAITDGLVGWPPTLEPAVERWPWLRSWCDVIARLLGGESGGSLQGPGEWIDGPYELMSRFGTAPATTQTQLPG